MRIRPGAQGAMISVRTLGAFDIRDADGRRLPVGRQPKRQAVLLYLLLARPRGLHRRDTLLAMFWPESDRTRASHALSQALNWLARIVGPDAIVRPTTEEIGIDRGTVTCDAWAFCDAVAAGDAERALSLYGGELLPGFNVQGGSEFERWLDAERRHLGGRAVEAAVQLLAASRQSGDDAGALHWARRRLELEPWSDAALRDVLNCHEQLNDPASAVLAYDEFTRRLAHDLGLTPSKETADRMARLREGHVAVEPHEPPRRPAAPVAAALPAASPQPQSGGRGSRRRSVALAGLVLVAGLLIVVNTFRGGGNTDPGATGDRVAVMFFDDDSRDQDLRYLATAITTSLAGELAAVNGLDVLSLNAMRQFRGRAVPLDSITGAVGARWLVGGSVSVSNATYRVNVELIDGRSGTAVHAARIERPTEEVFPLVDAIVDEVATGLRENLGRQIRRDQWRAGTSSTVAWELAKQADHLWQEVEWTGSTRTTDRRLEYADSLLVRSIEADPRWAEPRILRGLIAEQRALLHMREREVARRELKTALALADTAVKLDDRNAGAWELRGTVRFHEYLLLPPTDADSADRLLRAGEQDLLAALRLDPSRARAEARLGYNLYRQGRFEDAFDAGLRALQADVFLRHPDEIRLHMFTSAFHMGDDDEAAQRCEEIRQHMADTNPQAFCSLLQLAWSEVARADPRLAEYNLERAGSSESREMREAHRPYVSMVYAAVLARAGMADSARAVIRQWSVRGSPFGGDLLELEAAAWTALGEPDSAVALLEEAIAARPASRSRILAMRYFEPLRDLEAFRALASDRRR
jgi:DNA-binding SARP family transcriptional activator/TolB-like protein/tetratricopeptide (TPR) repeat protein